MEIISNFLLGQILLHMMLKISKKGKVFLGKKKSDNESC